MTESVLPGMAPRATHSGSGEMWGNFSQASSMFGMINGAARLSVPWDTAI